MRPTAGVRPHAARLPPQQPQLVTAPAVFVTGGTGYLGSALLPQLTARGHRVRVLVRGQSVGKLPSGCEPVVGDALDPA
ncbi:MAG TPA: NAD-dependent epimerase/dehydratase family protein, partial [Thermoanaerobaculia bacterium]|nr:NAD-dependent epimerase/dehydratase family protein [Thermoanaerobaculia bacterium]